MEKKLWYSDAKIVENDKNKIPNDDNNSILFPFLGERLIIALDIGGSLAKVVYNEKQHGHGYLTFKKFEIFDFEKMIEFVSQIVNNSAYERPLIIKATGGGAFKFQEILESRLNIIIEKEDEMECLIKGIDFFIKKVPNEVFNYSKQSPSLHFQLFDETNLYPYMLVNIGSGVSILKVSSEGKNL